MLMIQGSICRLKSINQSWKQKLLKSWLRKPQQTMSFTPSMTLWSVMGDRSMGLSWLAFQALALLLFQQIYMSPWLLLCCRCLLHDERQLSWSGRQHRRWHVAPKSLVIRWLQHPLMQISIASAQPIGTLIREGEHQPFKASACPIRALDYDESQMRDDDVIRHQQRSEVEYDC